MERVSIKNTSPGGEPVLVNSHMLRPGDELVVHLSPGFAVRVSPAHAQPPLAEPAQTAAVPNPGRNGDPDPLPTPEHAESGAAAPPDDEQKQEDATDG